MCLPATPLARWAGVAVPSLSRQTLRLRAAPPEPVSRLQSAHAAVVSALAPVPPGTRAVAKPGQVRRDGPEITLNEDLEPGFGLHPPGSLARPDQVLAGPERPLSLGDLERLADLGFKELRVRRVPRVGWAGRGGPSAGALLGHTGVSWVRERSFEWTKDLPELEPLDARIWVGVTPPPDARVVPSTHSGCLQPFWLRVQARPVEVGISSSLFEAWVSLRWGWVGLFEGWGVALPGVARRHARLAEPLAPEPHPVPVKLAEAAGDLPVAWTLPPDAAHLAARADGVVPGGPKPRGPVVEVWLLPRRDRPAGP